MTTLHDITMRPGTQDQVVFDEVWVEDVYRLLWPEHIEQIAGRPALDLGANVGAFTLRALDLGASSVVAVEPHPGNFAQLRSNIDALRRGPSVETLQGAVVGANLPTVGFIEGASSGGHRVGRGGAMQVRAFSIDELLSLEDEWGVMKVDIEGGEYEVIGWAAHELLQRVHFITMEFHAIRDGALGLLVEKLTETHHVQTLGRASLGGMIYARRY